MAGPGSFETFANGEVKRKTGAGRQAAIQFAVKEVARRLLAREQTVADAVAMLSRAIGVQPAETTPRESVAAARRALQQRMIDELLRLEGEGRGREAVGMTARKFAVDPLDPVEVESLARKLRRWRRRIPDTVRLPTPKSSTE